MSEDPLVRVQGLEKHYPVTTGLMRREVERVRAVDGISFTLRRGETLGIVGESGCGKSTAARAMLRLEDPTAGRVVFDGADLTAFDDAELRRFRRRAQFVFQDPSASFDPRMSVGESIAEPLVIHGVGGRDRRREIVVDLLERVGFGPEAYHRYPHEFSGGQKQRLAIARALVVNPDLIVADEPTSALDVSVQAEILTLLNEIQSEFGVAIVFISHDLGVIREVCDRVAVMYLGEFVETAPAEALFETPQHPYTRALLSSIPQPDPRQRGMGEQLRGDVPSPSSPPPGCRFHTRCPNVIQSEGSRLPQPEWQSVVAFQHRVTGEGVDVAAAREFVAADTDREPSAAPDAAVAAAIREEFDLPDQLSDATAETAVAEAIESLLAGDEAAAAASLAESFETVCRSTNPALASHGADREREVACHLHDSDVPADPPWLDPPHDAVETDD